VAKDALSGRIALHAALADVRSRRDRRGVRRRSVALRDRAEPADARGGAALSLRSILDRRAAGGRGHFRAAARRLQVLSPPERSRAAQHSDRRTAMANPFVHMELMSTDVDKAKDF